MRIDRTQIPYMKMIEVFEDLVFRGSKHIKRGLGITIFSGPNDFHEKNTFTC